MTNIEYLIAFILGMTLFGAAVSMITQARKKVRKQHRLTETALFYAGVSQVNYFLGTLITLGALGNYAVWNPQLVGVWIISCVLWLIPTFLYVRKTWTLEECRYTS